MCMEWWKGAEVSGMILVVAPAKRMAKESEAKATERRLDEARAPYSPIQSCLPQSASSLRWQPCAT